MNFALPKHCIHRRPRYVDMFHLNAINIIKRTRLLVAIKRDPKDRRRSIIINVNDTLISQQFPGLEYSETWREMLI